MSANPNIWQDHIRRVCAQISGDIHNPYVHRDIADVSITEAKTHQDLSIDICNVTRPKILSANQESEHVLQLPRSAYLKARIISLSIVKCKDFRNLNIEYSGHQVTLQAVRNNYCRLFDEHMGSDRFLREVDVVLAELGSSEPIPNFSILGSESEVITLFALLTLAIREYSRFLQTQYFHAGGWTLDEEDQSLKACIQSLITNEALITGSMSLVNWLKSDLEFYGLSEDNRRYSRRLVELSQIAGLASAIMIDLTERWGYEVDFVGGRHASYDSLSFRLSSLLHGFQVRLSEVAESESVGLATRAFLGGQNNYWHAIGFQPKLEEFGHEVYQGHFDSLVRLRKAVVSSAAAAHGGSSMRRPIAWHEGIWSKIQDIDWRSVDAEFLRMAYKRVRRSTEYEKRSRRFSLVNSEGPAVSRESADEYRESYISAWRGWLDPLELFRGDLTYAVMSEYTLTLEVAESHIRKHLVVPPATSDHAYAMTRSLDVIYQSFQIEIGRGLLGRLGLILRCLFDRAGRGERLHTLHSTLVEIETKGSAVAGQKGSTSVDDGADIVADEYRILFGAQNEKDGVSLDWWRERMEFSEEESFETRNGLRYGYLFILFHELAHIHRRHFEGRDAARHCLDVNGQKAVQRGMELDADVVALLNLIVYIESFVDIEASFVDREEDKGLFTCVARGNHFRAAFFGIFSVLSCLSPFRWSSSSSKEEIYFDPARRLGFAVKALDRTEVATDGRAMFACFPWLQRYANAKTETERRGVVWSSGPHLKWNWSDFLMACLLEWDAEVLTFVNDMNMRYELPVGPNPFGVQRAGLELSRETFEKARESSLTASEFIQTESVLFLKGDELRQFWTK